MPKRMALIGKATTREGMDAHHKLVKDGRPHCDGWTPSFDPRYQAQLKQQLEEDGYFWLFAEHGGEVRWKVKVTDAHFFKVAVPFDDPAHPDSYDACAIFVYAGSERIRKKRTAFRLWIVRADGRKHAASSARRAITYVVAE